MQRWLFLSTLVWDQIARGGCNAGRGSELVVRHFLVYGSDEKCVQYCCWWRLIIRNYLRPVHASFKTMKQAFRVCVCRRGLCLCMSKFECIQVIYQSWQEKKTKFEHRNLASPGKSWLPSNLLHMKGCRSCVPLWVLDCSHLTVARPTLKTS